MSDIEYLLYRDVNITPTSGHFIYYNSGANDSVAKFKVIENVEKVHVANSDSVKYYIKIICINPGETFFTVGRIYSGYVDQFYYFRSSIKNSIINKEQLTMFPEVV